MKQWSESDTNLLLELWPTSTHIEKIREQLTGGQTIRAIYAMVARLGIKRIKHVTCKTRLVLSDEQIVFIRDNWSSQMSLTKIAKGCRISKDKLKSVAIEMGLEQSRPWVVFERQSSQWPQEQTDAVKSLWMSGHSAGEIAFRMSQQFGAQFTRSAILGKLNRLGTKRSPSINAVNRQHGPQRRARPKPKLTLVQNHPSRTKPSQAGPVPSLVFDYKPPEVRLDPDKGGCAFPVGDRALEADFYCGHPKEYGSYCAFHARICFRGTASSPRREYVSRMKGLGGSTVTSWN